MRKENSAPKRVFPAWHFLIFFLLAAFVVTCSVLLFFSGADIPEEVVRSRARITLFNIICLSAVFTAIDIVRRKLTVERPVRRFCVLHKHFQTSLEALNP